ncbi:MAG: response regulator [Magnetococcus sp. YQC-5]
MITTTQELPKILVVDDKAANRISLKNLLADVSAEIVEAASGNEALTQCLYHDFALILLDVQMPIMDGYEVSRNLRALEQTRAVPILFVTATFGEESHKRKAYDVGAVDYILKPIEAPILISKVTVFLDLYNQRRAFELQAMQLAEKNSQLEVEILERQRVEQELIQARQVAEEANLAKSRFLATMSHEIRTPMNGILGFAQLLARTQLSEKQTLFVKTIIDSGESLLTVINDILDFSKIEARKVTLETIAFNPAEIMEKAMRLFSSSAQKKGVALRMLPVSNLPTSLIGDPNRLRQILHNLISNAVKFTEQGEIRLGIEPMDMHEQEVTLCFSVEDTGIGIPLEAQQTLFEAFVQADSSTTRKYGGSGLGLSICNGLAKLMGGEIELKSDAGQGSLFRLKVRFATPPASTQQQAISAPSLHKLVAPGPAMQPRILIAEDDPINQLFIRETMTALGFTNFTIAGDGSEALKLLETDDFHLILMDCQMPVLDGWQTTQEIRRREAEQPSNRPKKRIPILALTASVMTDEKQHCITAGMDDFLCKPIQTELLLNAINYWLAPERAKKTANPEESNPNHPTPEIVHASPNVSTSIPPLDQEEWQKLIKLLGKKNVQQLTTAFLTRLPDKLASIREAVDLDTTTLHKRTHVLKGNCGMIKASAMYAVCQQLTDLCHSGSTHGAVTLVDMLEAEAARLIPILQQEFGLNSDVSEAA